MYALQSNTGTPFFWRVTATPPLGSYRADRSTACHADRVLALLGRTGVVDDPRFDQSVTLSCRQDHFSHFRQYLLVRPGRLANEMQQRLVLRCRPVRRRYGSRSSCARTALSSPGNNPAAGQPGPHAQSHPQVLRHQPQIATCCYPPMIGDPSPAPLPLMTESHRIVDSQRREPATF
jgi:hypothetical protein